MRPLTILAIAQIPLYAFGAMIAISATANAATPNSDGITVEQSTPAPAAPAAPPTQSVEVGDGDTVTAIAGSTFMVQMDPKTGDYHTIVAGPQQ
jgi:hypothetical protein